MRPFKLLPGNVILLFQGPLAVAQQQEYSPAVEATIKAVENNLSGNLHLQDSTNYFNLSCQMSLYDVNGISIPLVQDYKTDAGGKATGFHLKQNGKEIPVKKLD